MFGHGVQRKRASSSSGTDLSDALTGVAEATKNAFSPQGQSEMPTLRHSTFSTSKAPFMQSQIYLPHTCMHTDLPAILSGDILAFLEPQEEVWPRQSGQKFTLLECHSKYQDSLAPYDGICGFSAGIP